MVRTRAAWVIAALALAARAPAQEIDPYVYEGTYSIIARDPDTGELGMGVQSRAFAVGYRTWTAKGGVAIFAHQAASNPYYGRVGMVMLEAGLPPEEVLKRLVASDEGSGSRQVAILDIHGRTASWDGDGTSEWTGHQCGVDYCAQGNTLSGPAVVADMARTFEATKGQPLADRLLAALDAAEAAGGDRRGRQAAAMTVVKAAAGAGGYSDIVLDLRVNDHPLPLVELRRLLTVFRAGDVIANANRAFDAGDRQGALNALLQLRDKIPEKDDVWVALASMYLRMDRRADALAALRRAVEINPRAPNNIARNRAFDAVRSDPEFARVLAAPASR